MQSVTSFLRVRATRELTIDLRTVTSTAALLWAAVASSASHVEEAPEEMGSLQEIPFRFLSRSHERLPGVCYVSERNVA